MFTALHIGFVIKLSNVFGPCNDCKEQCLLRAGLEAEAALARPRLQKETNESRMMLATFF